VWHHESACLDAIRPLSTLMPGPSDRQVVEIDRLAAIGWDRDVRHEGERTEHPADDAEPPMAPVC